MTDAAVSVTQSAVERFTEQYLRSLGCAIEKRESRWEVTVPEGADTELPIGDVTLICGNDAAEQDGDEELLHPESGFFQQAITEASKRAPSGKISIDTRNTEVELPSWLQKGAVEVSDAQFTPYYDRTAIVMLFRVSIETVSEYQSELLRAIALDIRSRDYLPKLEETFLERSSLEVETAISDRLELKKAEVSKFIDSASDHLADRVQPQIDEIHQEASRAADAEVEEYRQLQQQRIRELEEKLSNLSSKIDELSEAINSSGQEERVRALKDRKELNSKYDDVEAELTDLRQRRDRGFPEKQREIRGRHALDVRISPLTVTQVEYEQGEIELELTEEEITQTVTVGYGSGVGVTETVQCGLCNQDITQQNPLQTIQDGLQCMECTPTDDI